MIKDWTKLMFGEWYGFVAIGFTIATGFSLSGKNLILPLKTWVVFLFLSLLYASFASYQKAFREYSKSRPEYQITKKSVSIMNWLGSPETNKVNPVFAIQFSAEVEIRNHIQRPIDVKVVLDSIDSSWSLAQDVSGITLEVSRRPDNVLDSATLGNPVTLEALALTYIHIKVSIPVRSSTDFQGNNYLEHPNKFAINLRFEPVGQKPIRKSVECDLSQIHNAIEQNIVSWIRSHYTQNDKQGLQYLQMLKKYWGIESELK